MKNYLAKLAMIASLVFVGITLHAGNPGKSAMNCVSTSTNSNKYDNLIFKNNCGYKIFVVWCGDLKSSKKRCGDGSRNTYYTHSHNIYPYKKHSVSLKNRGSYSYAACKGGIGFGSKGIKHPARSNGRFECTSW